MTATPRLVPSEVQESLRRSLRTALQSRCPSDDVLARTECIEPYDMKLWHVLASDMGLVGLAVSEADGGSGASYGEVAVVMEELGRALAQVPFLGSAVLTTTALQLSKDEDLLRSLVNGAEVGALAVPLPTMPGAAFPSSVTSDGALLTGEVSSVPDAIAADVIVVPVVDAQGAALYSVAAGDVSMAPVVSLDATRRLSDLTLDGVIGRRLASGSDAENGWSGALRTSAAMLCSEQVGLAERCLELTIHHLKSRYQFGRLIGSYQGLKHRLAELWVSIGQARAAARYAAECVSSGSADTAVAVAVAQAHCSAVAVRAAEECIQMHGGMGFTWEHPAHLYLKRAKSDAIAFGTPDRHRAALAQLVNLPMT